MAEDEAYALARNVELYVFSMVGWSMARGSSNVLLRSRSRTSTPPATQEQFLQSTGKGKV
jgi:hypothetical protein